MMMKGILLFSLIQSLLFRSFEAESGHILLSSRYWNAFIGWYSITQRILFYWIPSHVGIRGNEKEDAAARAGLLRRVTVSILARIRIGHTIISF